MPYVSQTLHVTCYIYYMLYMLYILHVIHVIHVTFQTGHQASQTVMMMMMRTAWSSTSTHRVDTGMMTSVTTSRGLSVRSLSLDLRLLADIHFIPTVSVNEIVINCDLNVRKIYDVVLLY